MKIFKPFLLLLLFSASAVLAQVDTVNFKFWVPDPNSSFGQVFSNEQMEGSVLEGESFEIPAVTLPDNAQFSLAQFQGVYDAAAGGSFTLPEGSLNNNITLDIYFRELNPTNNLINLLADENLFLFIEIDVTVHGESDTLYSGDNHFYFQGGNKMEFCLPFSDALLNILPSMGLDNNLLGFAYFISQDWTDAGIETVVGTNGICFRAEHLSKFGGGRRGIGDPTTDIEPIVGTPESFDLNQNFPNPFNPSTNITFSITDAGMVTLKVYNTLGEEVATIVNEYKDAGNYKVDFDGSNLSSGIYFYELKSGKNSLTRKMMLVK